MQVKVEISARHLHLCQKDLEKLFGSGYRLKIKNKLSQAGEFAARETVRLSGKKANLSRVRIIGPTRKKTQVELSMTDCRKLGIDAPIRLSGDVLGTPGIKIIGPKGIVNLKQGVIVAKRHLHLSTKKAKELKLKNNDKVKVKIKSERALIFEEIIVRVADNFDFNVHLDTDEANAAGLKSCGKGELII